MASQRGGSSPEPHLPSGRDPALRLPQQEATPETAFVGAVGVEPPQPSPTWEETREANTGVPTMCAFPF